VLYASDYGSTEYGDYGVWDGSGWMKNGLVERDGGVDKGEKKSSWQCQWHFGWVSFVWW
jgi:hypothetical protein